MFEGIDTSGIRPSLWFANCQLPHFQPLRENIKADICIIGGGITGLTTAYKLVSEGQDVVLLEDGNIASGETGRTSGHLCNVVDDYFFQLEAIYGEKVAKIVAESHSAAIDLIEKIIKQESIDCDFKRINGYLFLGPNDSISTLLKEKEAAEQAGLKVELLKEGNINQFKMGPCLRFYHQARFHPLKYLAALSDVIIRKGGKIFTLTHAKEIKPGKIIEIKTVDGYVVKAKKVVIATNAPVFDKDKFFAKQEANRTYVIGFKIENKGLEDALFWDTSQPYHYMRFHSIENNSNQWIISVGGEDHRTGKNVDKKALLEKLANWAIKTIPQLGEIKFYWSGQISEAVDHLAYIGFDPTQDKNIFVGTGYSGSGLTHGTISAILLTDQIMGRKNPWLDVYNSQRKPSKKFGSHEGHHADKKGSSDYFALKDITDDRKLKPGEGGVIRKGDSKIAVYKDKEGNLHFCTAVCTHMGGIVTWNNLEKSWDCPLHGSRFTPLGDVMNGPANKRLEKEKITPKKEIPEPS